MKKLFTFFLIGQLIIFGYIFNKSVFEIYTLNNIGNPTLNKYYIDDNSNLNSDKLGKLYDYLIINHNSIQVVKMPISNTTGTLFKIYNSDSSNVKKIVSISDNIFEYYKLTKHEFVDSTGVFYSDIKAPEINSIHNKLGITISNINKDYISYKKIITDNFINFIILLVLSQTVIFVYTITRGKMNAVKKMLGHSPVKIVVSILKDFLKIEVVIFIVVVIINSTYYILINKFSLFYMQFLMLFLLCIIGINILMMMLTQISIRMLDINAAIKNRIYSEKLNIIMKIVKIILIISTTVSITICVKYYRQANEYSDKYARYNELNNLYSSYGFNSDEYNKCIASSDNLKSTADSVKKMYQINSNTAYFMKVNAINYLQGDYLQQNGLTRSDIMNSYKDNYIILNKNYIKDYLNMNLDGELNKDIPTILVPQKYKTKESEIKKEYINTYEDLLNYNQFYRIKETVRKINDINIIYVKDNKSYKILSTFQYEDGINISITDPIIIVDTGTFDSCFYFDQLSLCGIAFKFDSRDTYANLLQKYGLNSIFKARTIGLTPSFWTKPNKFFNFLRFRPLFQY